MAAEARPFNQNFPSFRQIQVIYYNLPTLIASSDLVPERLAHNLMVDNLSSVYGPGLALGSFAYTLPE